MNSKELVNLLSAGLTPVLAIIAAYIAYQQWRTNELRRRHELYEGRLRVFKAVHMYLVHIMQEAKIDFTKIGEMYTNASEAPFLFGKEVQDYIDLLYRKGMDLRALNRRLYNPDGSPALPTGPERTRVAEDEEKLLNWFNQQFEVSRRLFQKHMGVS